MLNTSSTVTVVAADTVSLPFGSYTVSYELTTEANVTTSHTATMTVAISNGQVTGTFSTVALDPFGPRTLRITTLTSGDITNQVTCSSTITSNNTVDICPEFGLGTVAARETRTGSGITVDLTNGALPVGSYTVTYSLSESNTGSNLTAPMEVTTANTGSFTTVAVANTGFTTVTVQKIETAFCSEVFTTQNTSRVYICKTYALASISSSRVCVADNPSTITLTSTPADLPVGTYDITYDLGSQSGLTATITVTQQSSQTTGAFDTPNLPLGAHTITIVSLATGSVNSGTYCLTSLSQNNSATIVYVGSQPTDHYRTRNSGQWNDPVTWESSPDGVSWCAATTTPGSNATSTTVLHAVSSSVDLDLKALVVPTNVTFEPPANLYIDSSLTINGTLDLSKNSTNLYIAGATLTLNAQVVMFTGGKGNHLTTGASIIGDANTTINVNVAMTLPTILGGIGILNVADNVDVTLGSDLTVHDDITVGNGGSFAFNGRKLTLGGSLLNTGTGSYIGGATSALELMAGTSAGSLPAISGGLGTLIMLRDEDLAADLTVYSDLTLNGGVFTIDSGATLTVAGTLSTSNEGSIHGGNGGNLVIAGTGSAVTLPATAALGTLTVTRPAGIVLAANILVHHDIDLNGGGIDKAGHNLITKGSITGSGVITGSGWIKFQSNNGNGGRSLQGRSYTNLELDDAQGFSAAGDITVSGELHLKDGHLNLGVRTLDLGTTGSVTGEASARRIMGTTGKIRSQRSLAQNSVVNFGNGVSIDTKNNANLGSTVIADRTFAQASKNGATAIPRQFVFSGLATPTSSMDVVFTYDEAEVTGVGFSEVQLGVFASTNGGTSWYEPTTQNRDYSNNRITVTFSTGFAKSAGASSFTNGSPFSKGAGIASTQNDPSVLILTGGMTGGALPVELVSFKGQLRNDMVQLAWKTATETNNYGFEVERAALASADASTDGMQWSTIGFVAGNGTTSSERSYRYSDDVAKGALRNVEHFAYRLRQIDRDGTQHLSPVVVVSRFSAEPVALALDMPYPNPTESEAIATVRLAESRIATVQLVSVDGKVLETIAAEQQLDAGVHSFRITRGALPAGMYYVVVQSADLRLVRPLTFVR